MVARARELVRQAAQVMEAEARVRECEAAEAAHAMPSVARAPKGDGCAWCPLLGACVSRCNCGTPQGVDGCNEVGRTGAGAKGAASGAIRHTRAQLAEAQELAERTAHAAANLAEARAALHAVAGEAAGIAALRALQAHGERQAVAIVAVLLGLPVLPTAREVAPAPEIAVLPTRRERKAARRPAVEVAAGAAGRVAGLAIGWAEVVAAPRIRAAAAELAAPIAAEARTQFGGHGRHARRPRPMLSPQVA